MLRLARTPTPRSFARACGLSFALALGVVLTGVASHGARPGGYGASNPPPAPGTPRFVQIEAFEGLPRDSMERRAVLAAFRGAFAESDLAVERPGASAGAWLDDGRAPNRFRWLEGWSADTIWTLQVVFGFPRELPREVLAPGGKDAGGRGTRPRGTRATRGFNAAFAALSPEARFAGARPLPLRVALAFPPDTSAEYPWALAGRAAGRLALEALHHASGDLPPDRRFALDRAVRVP